MAFIWFMAYIWNCSFAEPQLTSLQQIKTVHIWDNELCSHTIHVLWIYLDLVDVYTDVMGLAKNHKLQTIDFKHSLHEFICVFIHSHYIDSSVLGVNCQVPQAKMSVVSNVKASNNNHAGYPIFSGFKIAILRYKGRYLVCTMSNLWNYFANPIWK